MENTKVTKRMMYEAIINVFGNDGTLPEGITGQNVVDFCENEIGILDRKREKAKNYTRKEKEDAIMPAVKAALTDEPMTTGDITVIVEEALADTDIEVTAAKVSARLTKLAKAGEIVKETVSVGEAGKKRRLMAYRLPEIEVDMD